jgi:hypothetical protein
MFHLDSHILHILQRINSFFDWLHLLLTEFNNNLPSSVVSCVYFAVFVNVTLLWIVQL